MTRFFEVSHKSVVVNGCLVSLYCNLEVLSVSRRRYASKSLDLFFHLSFLDSSELPSTIRAGSVPRLLQEALENQTLQRASAFL